MSQLRVTKRATLSALQKFLPLLLLGCVVLMFATGVTDHEFGNSETDDFVNRLPVILLAIAAVLCLANNGRCKSTYISVYDDHVEGVGIAPNGFNSQPFRFMKSENYMLHQGNNHLSVACGGKSLNIFLSAQDIKDVMAANSSASYAPRQPVAPKAPKPQTPKPQSPKPQAPKASPIPQAPKNPTFPKTGAPEAVELFCVYCGFKCRVPAGKGKINITCPNCQKKFQHET